MIANMNVINSLKNFRTYFGKTKKVTFLCFLEIRKSDCNVLTSLFTDKAGNTANIS